MSSWQNADTRRLRVASLSAAMSRSAESRQCPKCGRKSALKFVSDEMGFGRYCRWNDCDYDTYRLRELSE